MVRMIPSVEVPVADVLRSFVIASGMSSLINGWSRTLSTFQSCRAAVFASVIVIIAFTIALSVKALFVNTRILIVPGTMKSPSRSS